MEVSTMPLPTNPASSWTRSLDLPSQLFGGFGDTDYELYEEDGQFVLTIDMPGFETDEIDVRWHEGRLVVSAEHLDEGRNRQKTYHRSFRVPKTVVEDEIGARYHNGVLEVELPITEDSLTRGREIPIEG